MAATRQAEGNNAYWYCEDCGRYFAHADASEEISQDFVPVIFCREYNCKKQLFCVWHIINF